MVECFAQAIFWLHRLCRPRRLASWRRCACRLKKQSHPSGSGEACRFPGLTPKFPNPWSSQRALSNALPDPVVRKKTLWWRVPPPCSGQKCHLARVRRSRVLRLRRAASGRVHLRADGLRQDFSPRTRMCAVLSNQMLLAPHTASSQVLLHAFLPPAGW